MSKYIGYVGESKTGRFTVVDYLGDRQYLVIFEDGHDKVVPSSSILSGRIKNPYYPSVHGVGYMGSGAFTSRLCGISTKEYMIWANMLRRCYHKNTLLEFPTYQGCSVQPDWHNFQNFAKWRTSHKNYGKSGYALDKDLRLLGNKSYSPDTCDLIPHQINTLLLDSMSNRGDLPVGVYFHKDKFTAQYSAIDQSLGGKRMPSYIGRYSTAEEAFQAYKKVKEAHVKETAEKYKSEIHIDIYNNLMNWEVTNDV